MSIEIVFIGGRSRGVTNITRKIMATGSRAARTLDPDYTNNKTRGRKCGYIPKERPNFRDLSAHEEHCRRNPNDVVSARYLERRV